MVILTFHPVRKKIHYIGRLWTKAKVYMFTTKHIIFKSTIMQKFKKEFEIHASM